MGILYLVTIIDIALFILYKTSQSNKSQNARSLKIYLQYSLIIQIDFDSILNHLHQMSEFT